MRDKSYENTWREQAQSGPITISKVNAFLQRVFVIMGAGLAITGLTAYLFANYLTANPDMLIAVFGSGLKWLIFLAPLAFVMVLSFGINKLSYFSATIIFGIYSAVMGLSLSSIFFAYTTTSIATTFFVTSGMFLSLAAYGALTKRDLSKLGSILVMALFGVIIASIINIFVASGPLYWIITLVSIVVFSGLTAYDMQKITQMSQNYFDHNAEDAKKASLLGALSLYLDFINLFLMLLRLFGNRN